MKLNRRKFLQLFGIVAVTPVVANAISILPIKPPSGGDCVIKCGNTGISGNITIGDVWWRNEASDLRIANILGPSNGPVSKEYGVCGNMYFNTDDGYHYIYDGANWIKIINDPTRST
jgi:hypothetical protein